MKTFVRTQTASVTAKQLSIAAVMLAICVVSFASIGLGDVIIDNGQAGTTSTGTWAVSGGTTPYGADSLWARNGATYTWQMSSQPAGFYEVLMWWSATTSRPTAVSTRINYDGGQQTLTTNQSTNAGQWNSLGTYYFDTSGSVSITAATGDALSTCADAVWFRLAYANAPPVALIDSITPNPASVGQEIQFTGHGTDDHNAVTAYSWESNVDGVLSSASSFSTSTLSQGTHTITFAVQDSNGIWSADAVQTITVGQASADIIIDNGAAGTSSTGTWAVSGAAGAYGTNSVWSYSGATYIWSPTPATTGTYRVSMWWTAVSSRSTSVPVSIQNAGTTANVTVNQTLNGGQWNALGDYVMNAGTAYKVTITAPTGSPPSTCADAVKFTYLGAANNPPTASITSITPNPANVGQSVSFAGSGNDTDGTIAAYKWESNIAGVISDQASFNTNSLVQGSHQISFSVQDNGGAWSAPVIQTLTVGQVSSDTIIDNGSPNCTYTGTWAVSGATGAYGADSVWSYSGATYSWSFTPTTSGTYSVSMWWTALASRSPSVPVSIQNAGTAANVTINQTQNGGQWNVLGQYTFNAGTAYKVTITAPTGTPPSTCADAVKFAYVGAANVSPTASISSITPNPAQLGQTISFAGSGTDTDGTIATYKWQSDIDGNLSNLSSFTKSTLSQGTHTITFTVQDDDGAWSASVTQTLVIQQPANVLPTASITSITPSPANVGQSVSFVGTGTDTDGTVTAYRWQSSINGVISSQASFSTSLLSPGTHTISFKVQDNRGDWSTAVTRTLTINQTTANIILDNGATGTSSTGTWQVSGGPNPYGTNSLYASSGATYTWSFKPTITGNYQVYLWWTAMSSRSTAVPYDIQRNGGTTRVTVNQRLNGGQWNSAGTFAFTAGQTYTIKVTAPSSNNACADAVRWTNTSGTNAAPTTQITSILPSPTTFGQTVEFCGAGFDSDGTIAAYEWKSNISGTIGSASIFTTNTLTAGTHTISLRVQDNSGTWSPTVTQTLVINTVTNNPPTASITSITPNPATVGQTVNFAGSGIDTDGTITAYEWKSNISGTIGSTSSFSTSTLPAGTHTISLRVQDNGGAWSATVTQTLVVNIVINNPPTASITSVTPNPATVGQTVSFAGSGTDTDGTIAAYSWESSIDGTLSTQSSFTKNNLSVGTHTISFKVQDNSGAWSTTVTRSLAINSGTPADIIIDNGSVNCTYTGSWGVSGATGAYGTDSYWARDGATYTWKITPSVAANYEVFAWWTQYSTRATSVPIDIVNASGTNRVTVNQQTNGGKWNSLGVFPFQAGTTYNITATAVNGATISTCADAIKLSYNGPINIPLPPTALITSISPNPGMPNQDIVFKGKATDSDGTIQAYSWRSSIDGTLGTTSPLTKKLSAGTHTVYFKAQDNSGLWSPEVSATVDVGRENIYIAPCYGGNEVGVVSFRGVLQSIGATKTTEDEWTYVDTTINKTYYIHFIKNGTALVSAMARDGAHIILSAHSNYGIGPLFSTSAEDASTMLTDVRYVDDDRFVKLGTPMVGVSAYGMRTGQAYPYWWPIYKNGKTAVAPYDFGDPNGPPAYNYYLTYKIPGDPNHYKVSTVNKSEIQRFSDSGKPAWYSITGETPDPNKLEHKQFFITNSAPWSPSIVSSGTWTQYQDAPLDRANSQYFKENYVTNPAGTGSDYTKFMFTIPQTGQYKVRAWWPGLSTNATNAPFIVNSASGDTTVRVNQTTNGRQWNDLGTYTFNPGDYYVKLTDEVSSGNVVADGVQIGHVNNPPDVVQSDFVALPLSGTAPLNVMLVNAGTGDLTGRTWNCGDGFTNTTRDQLSHIYERPGTYTVTLTITGPLGSSTKTKTNYITVWPEGTTGTTPLRAEFAAYNKFTSQAAASVPMAAMFADISTGDLRKGITYTPTSSFTGTTSLTYTVKDALGNVSNPGTINITVSDNPVAKDDTATTSPKNFVVIRVLSNDKAPAGKLLADSIQITANPSYGNIDINDIGGYIVYTPISQTIERNDTFKYTVADSNGHTSNQATVSVTISNHPVAADDLAYTKKGTKTTINVLSNDVDTDGLLMPNSVLVNVSPTNGIVEVNHVSGLITYTPLNSTFIGQDTFRYSVADNDNLISNQALVTVKVDNNPTALDDTAVTAVGKAVTVDILGNDKSMNGSLDPNSITITSGPASGSYVIHKNTWLWNFGDGQISRDQNPVHLYMQPGIYNVSLTVTDATGATQTETKQNYIRVVVYEKNIDNVDYPKSSYGGWVGKTMLKTKSMDIPYDNLKYGRMLYESCNSGDYYIQTLSHGLMYYTIATSGGSGSLAYLQLYLQGGKTDKEIWEAMQQTQACYDFYNFNLTPSQQPTIPLSSTAMSTPKAISLNTEQKADIEEMKSLSILDTFERLSEPEYIANQALTNTAISQAYSGSEYEAVEMALARVQSPIEPADSNGVVELKTAKSILKQFADVSVPRLLSLYPQRDASTGANVITAAGPLANNAEIREMLIKALDDKTVTIDTKIEIGHPLRICDVAYNQLVLNLKINDVLRTIGTGMADDTRDYHIDVLRKKL